MTWAPPLVPEREDALRLDVELLLVGRRVRARALDGAGRDRGGRVALRDAVRS